MAIEGFAGSKFKRKVSKILFFSYVLILGVLFFSYIVSAEHDAALWVKSDMQKRIEKFFLTMEASAGKTDSKLNRLAANNSLKIPLSMKVVPQVGALASKLIKEGAIPQDIIIADNESNIMFNSTGLSLEELGVRPADGTVSGFTVCNDRLYRINCVHVYYNDMVMQADKVQIGFVASMLDFLDSYGAAVESIKGSGYRYYGFVNKKAVFVLDENEAVTVDRPLSGGSWDKLGKGFSKLVINGDSNLIYSIELRLFGSGTFFLSLAVPYGCYRDIENLFMRQALLKYLLVAGLFTIIAALAYVFLNYYIKNSLSKSLEMQTLRMQRHDFAKHLNIDYIGGMYRFKIRLPRYTWELEESLRQIGIWPTLNSKKNGKSMSLFIAQKIIKRYGGRFEVSTENGYPAISVFLP